MTIRQLTPQEYPLLATTAEGFVPDPDNSIAVAAFDDSGQIIGRMLLVAMPHLEGTWVAEGARGGSIGFRMEREMVKAAAVQGLKAVMAYTDNEAHTNYLERLEWKRTNFTVLQKEL